MASLLSSVPTARDRPLTPAPSPRDRPRSGSETGSKKNNNTVSMRGEVDGGGGGCGSAVIVYNKTRIQRRPIIQTNRVHSSRARTDRRRATYLRLERATFRKTHDDIILLFAAAAAYYRVISSRPCPYEGIRERRKSRIRDASGVARIYQWGEGSGHIQLA